MQDSLERADATSLVGALFADPAFAAFKARGAPFAVVRPRTGAVLWANAAAAAHFSAGDASALARALFDAGGWLDGVAARATVGGGPQLVRVGPPGDARARTALVKAAADPEGDALLGFAVPDARASEAPAFDAWLRPAWAEVERVASRSGPDTAGEESPGEQPRGEPAPVEAGSGAALLRRGQVAVLRDRLARAVDGAATVRILWRADAAGVAEPADAGLLARLGVPLDFASAPLPDLLAPFDAPGAGQLSEALAGRRTWSGLGMRLPVAGGGALAPLCLSASPVFGPDRAFAGYRGFGTLDLGGLDLAPARAAEQPPRLDEGGTHEPAADAAPEFAPAAPEPAADRPELPARADDVEGQAEGRGGNVVHLRAFQAPARAAPPDPAEELTHPGDGRLGDDLAFRALGEALRARIGAPVRPGPEPDLPEEVAVEVGGDGQARDAAADLLDQLPAAVLAVVGGAPVYANPAAAALLGFSGPGALLAAGRDVIEDGGELPALRDARGSVAPVSLRRSPASWGGAPAAVYLFEAAAAPPPPAAERDARSGELLDRVDDAVALLDGDGRVRRLNRRGEGWFGPLEEGGPGPSLAQLLAPESRPRALALLDEVRQAREAAAGPPSRREVLTLAGAGEPVPMMLTVGRLGGSGLYATLRESAPARSDPGRSDPDLNRSDPDPGPSDPGRAGADLRREAGSAAAVLAKINHEIRTPLSAILGFAEVMADERFGPLGNPRYKDYMRDIIASGAQVVETVEDLLDLSRIEAGQLDLAMEALDVNRIVSETVAQMAPEAHRGRVIVRTSLAGRLPSALADERSARQIVRNLLSNAIKFNEPGGQVIVSTALGEAGAVLLRVRDTGVGMAEGEIAAALEPFGAAPPGEPPGAGGLGLPLSRALAGANGASIAIRSRPREGTLVEVAFAAKPDGARDAG